MNLVLLVLLVALATVVSRVTALAVLPEATGRFAALVRRLPAPLFASLAALSLVGDGAWPGPPMLAAAACAVLSARWRSLLLTLAAGIAGYAVASLVTGA